MFITKLLRCTLVANGIADIGGLELPLRKMTPEPRFQLLVLADEVIG